MLRLTLVFAIWIASTATSLDERGFARVAEAAQGAGNTAVSQRWAHRPSERVYRSAATGPQWRCMSSGRVFRFGPTTGSARHLFVFLHGCGATAQSMIPIAFQFQARFPSAALVVPSGFNPDARGGAAQDWYSTRGLNPDNHRERVASILPDIEDLIRREQTNFSLAASRTVLIGFSQGGTVALETVKTAGLASAVVAFSARYARLPLRGARIASRIHLVHGAYDSVVSRVHAERAARVLTALHVPVTLDIVDDLGHALSHRAISLGSLRLLQGIYEGRRATLH